MMDERMQPIVVGVDGSAGSRAASEYAAEEAAARVTPLILVHAIAGTGDSDEVVAEAVGAAQAQHPALAVTGYCVAGNPVRVLTTMAAGAGLLVVGHRGRGARSGHDVGSVALRLIGSGPVPLLIHRPLARAGEVDLPRPVLVGVDPADGPDALAEFAFAEAALRGSPVRLIWLRPPEPGCTASDLLYRWSEKYPEVAVTATSRYGVDAAIALAAASHSAQLVVVGTTGRPAGGWAARALVDRAGCPVAIVTT
jgi:nucleotide-binding universal stress UspA family protein